MQLYFNSVIGRFIKRNLLCQYIYPAFRLSSRLSQGPETPGLYNKLPDIANSPTSYKISFSNLSLYKRRTAI